MEYSKSNIQISAKLFRIFWNTQCQISISQLYFASNTLEYSILNIQFSLRISVTFFSKYFGKFNVKYPYLSYILLTCLYLAIVVFAPSLALAQVTGLQVTATKYWANVLLQSGTKWNIEYLQSGSYSGTLIQFLSTTMVSMATIMATIVLTTFYQS